MVNYQNETLNQGSNPSWYPIENWITSKYKNFDFIKHKSKLIIISPQTTIQESNIEYKILLHKKIILFSCIKKYYYSILIR